MIWGHNYSDIHSSRTRFEERRQAVLVRVLGMRQKLV
jgi:hypothetical protein